MHSLVMTHGYPSHINDLIKYFQHKKYPGGDPWQVRTREIRFWDFVFPEAIEEKVMSDLMYFSKDPKPVMNSLGHVRKLLQLYSLFGNGKRLEPINPERYKATEFTQEEFKEPNGRYWWGYAHPIAIMRDGYHHNPAKGQELL